MRQLALLGATGSIGRSTLDVVARHPDRFRVVALAANRDVDGLAAACAATGAAEAAIADASRAGALESALRALGVRARVHAGPAALEHVATLAEVDTVVAAVVGAAGLPSALAAARAGKRILLANKEALVMSGPVFRRAVHAGGATVLPVDSEHNALFQCLPAGYDGDPARAGVERLWLTASGGPFRGRDAASLAAVTPDEACAHPNWRMGRKISVDSATLMNKGLEVIEAHGLFDLPADRIEVLVHPQSIVHSMVEYRDGSVLAQLGQPDMRTAIAHALAWPERIAAGVAPLDLRAVGRLEFEAPDLGAFPCLSLAYQALRSGGGAPTVLNAANEIAVEAFLERRLAFNRIPTVVADTLADVGAARLQTLEEVLELDARARERARRALI